MKKLYIFLIIALVAAASPAFSQGSAIKAGIGASFTLSEAFPVTDLPTGVEVNTPITISVPLLFSSFLLEPRVGYYTRSSKTTDKTIPSNPETTLTGSLLNLNVGAFYLIGLSTTAEAYLGLRVGWLYWSTDTKISTASSSTTTSRSGFSIGPAAGGDYFLSEYFSVGAEVGLMFYNIGDVTLSPAPSTDASDVSTNIIQTEASIIARFYFNR
jgi:hypothetical protein